MKTAQVIYFEGQQAIQLPPEFTVRADALAIRKDGDAIVLEPIKPADWPAGLNRSPTIRGRDFARRTRYDDR